jgi:hypothetical protein
MANFESFKSFNTLLDSACARHVVRDQTLFHDYVEKSISVDTATCGSLDALGSGDVEFRYPFGDKYVTFTLRGCLYAPTAPMNLLSFGTLVERASANRGKYEITFHQSQPVTHIVANCRPF